MRAILRELKGVCKNQNDVSWEGEAPDQKLRSRANRPSKRYKSTQHHRRAWTSSVRTPQADPGEGVLDPELREKERNSGDLWQDTVSQSGPGLIIGDWWWLDSLQIYYCNPLNTVY